MILIVYYLVFMVAGDFAAYFIGLFVEYEWGSQASLIVFLGACGVDVQTKIGGGAIRILSRC